MNKSKKVIFEILSYVAIIVVVILIKTYIASPIKVNGNSMYKTLHDKDVADATQAKDELFRVDQETIDRIDAVARNFIINQRGQTTVEQAREDAGRDE